MPIKPGETEMGVLPLQIDPSLDRRLAAQMLCVSGPLMICCKWPVTRDALELLGTPILDERRPRLTMPIGP